MEDNLIFEDIKDIKQSNANPVELDNFRNQLSNLNSEQLNQLFVNMSKNNNINPNDNWFDTLNQKNYQKFKLKNKISNLKNNRTSTVAKTFRDKKIQEKNKKDSNEQETDNTNQNIEKNS